MSIEMPDSSVDDTKTGKKENKMKKLSIAMGVACVALFANAATYSWSMQVTASPDDANPLVASVYAFDANQYSYSAISSALTTTGDSILANALGTGSFDGDGLASLSGTGLSDNGGSPLTASMYAILVGEDSGKKYFYYQDFGSVEVTDAVAAGGANFMLDYVNTGAISTWTSVAPEPTSGFLMLLGLAGLALRRKQK